MIFKRTILNTRDVEIIIDRLCQQLIENHQDFNSTVLVGIQPRGTFLFNRIINNLAETISNIDTGILDISFYRDDFRRRDQPIEPQMMDMNLTIEGKRVVLIDDVLYTGRSVRSAIDALMAFGRPESVELLTLVDRRLSRHLPIQANYIGKSVDAIDSEKVVVQWRERDGEDQVIMIKLSE